jgi:PAS domain-containing protein
VLEKNHSPAQWQNSPAYAANLAPNPAKCGIWECHLPFDTLTWSDEVYDLFELPRGFRISREETIGFYTAESRDILEEVRARALRDGAPFTLDAEIITALGKPRWLRITAQIEFIHGAPVRLFGTKQDITEEKRGLGHRP